MKPGDVVQFKSGSPSMTIISIDEEKQRAACIWYEGGTYHSEDFALVVLKPAIAV